jgi:hypothetical protein
MIQKSISLLVILTMALACQNENASSKIDASKEDVAFNPNVTQPSVPAQAAQTAVTEAPAVNGKYPTMVFNKKEHNFGTIKEGEVVHTTFEFSNTGETDLIISNASGSCGCTVPEFPKHPIKPGETGKMKVSFDSGGKPGKQQKSVSITCNTASGKDVLTIKAEVTPKANTNSTVTEVTPNTTN